MLKNITRTQMALTFVLCLSFSSSAQQRGAANGFQPSANVPAATQPAANTATPPAGADSERAQDGLTGPVRRVRTETAKLTNKNGQTVENQHVLIESSAYDIRGHKTENQYFPVAGATLTGREVYKYDEHGNISEMTLHDASGALVTKEVYTYEYDFVGNWTKMTTAVAVFENGQIKFEPTEITYRTISYYLDDNLTRMMQAAQAPKPTVAAPANNSNANQASLTTQPASAAHSQPAAQQSARALPQASAGSGNLVSTAGSVPGAAPVSGNSSGNATSRADDAPPARPATRILKPVSGGVLNGVAKSLPRPTYPDAAKRMRATGTVTVEVVVDETGHVISARATSGPLTLQPAAIQAARLAQFSPTMLSGQPVKVTGVINYNFQLEQ